MAAFLYALLLICNYISVSGGMSVQSEKSRDVKRKMVAGWEQHEIDEAEEAAPAVTSKCCAPILDVTTLLCLLI